MGVNGCVPGGTGEVFAFSIGDVLSVSLDISFGETEIKDKNFMAGFVQTNAEIIRLYITVDEMAVVNVLNSLNHLVNENKNAFQ